MIDTHAHIDTEAFDEDRLQIIEEAFNSGLEAIIIPAIEPKDFKRVLHAVSLSERIFCGMGIHPHNANEATRENLSLIEQMAAENEKVIAIGETGLDYYYDFNPADIQAKSFINQIAISKNLDLPLIIHNRESDEDMMKILRTEQDGKLRAVLHCFSGNEQMLEEVIDLGLMVSFTGNITFKKSTLAPVVEKVPMKNVMIETDSPYMTPVPNRGKRNKPSYVKAVAEKIAEIKSMNINEVIEMTTKNAKRFFNLPLLVLLFALIPMLGMAQGDLEEYYDDEEYIVEDEQENEYYNPFKKSIGIGFIAGTNTIVQTYKKDDDQRSQEGIFAIGGGLNYFLNDYFSITGSYIYSKNEKLIEKNPDLELEPNFHHMARASLYAYTTPYNVINFFVMVGPSYSYNKISLGKDYKQNPPKFVNEISDEWGINTGAGFAFNIDAKKAGVFVIQVEWKVDFMLESSTMDKDYRYDQNKDPDEYNTPVEIQNFYSVPQFKLFWYPKFNR